VFGLGWRRRAAARVDLRWSLACALCATLASLCVGPASAAAAPKVPRVVTPSKDALVTGSAVKVRVRSVSPRFSVLVGSRDVTSRFKRGRRGVLVGILRRGRDVKSGFARLVVTSGRGAARRVGVRTFVVGVRRKGLLSIVRRKRSRAALAITVRSALRARFDSVRLVLNGKRVRTRDWVRGDRTPARRWPLGRGRRFVALFGADDGLRFGRNKLTMTAWSRNGRFDRVSRRFRVTRRAPLVSAGAGKRLRRGGRVVLDGRRTRGWRGARVSYRWRIVRRPKGSKATLRRPRSARPRLVTDRRGRYRVRLVTQHVPRPRSARAAQAPVRSAVDELTVEATPAVEPIGMPVETIPSEGGGISLGGQVYGTSSPWLQMLVLDRQTLEVQSNESFGASSSVTSGDVEAAADRIDQLSSDHLIILSGGGRPVSASGIDDQQSQISIALNFMFTVAGGEPDSLWDWPGYFQRAFLAGNWSLIGVPNAEGSAHQNLYGMIYGETAGAGSYPGALTGWLQQGEEEGQDEDYEAYGFASGNYSTIDTQVPGSPPGVNTIRIGDDTYSSDPVPSGGGGFHVLILDSLLERTDERTFVTNNPANSVSVVDQMQEYISNNTSAGLGAPGYLVVVQSIGQPVGAIPNWVDDGPLVNDNFNPDQQIFRDETTWFSSDTGVTLAGALGELGGPAAHDQVAQMASPANQQVTPEYDSGGYTLVASTGALRDAAPIDPAAPPLSRSQAGSKTSSARVVGTLERDRQGLWRVDNASTSDAFQSASLATLAYQEPTPWPLSTTPEQKAANKYIASQLFRCPASDPDCNRPSDVRDAYWQNFDSDWDSRHNTLDENIDYPSGGSSEFDEATFDAVKQQLLTEMDMVADVYAVVQNWKGVFTDSSLSAYIDLQSIAAGIVTELNQQDSGQSSTANTIAVLGDSLWVAQSILEFSGQEEAAIAVGAVAGSMDVMADLSSSSGGGPDAAPVVADVTALGQELADRYTDLASSVGTVGEILVSDWGKLKQADDSSTTVWAFDQDVTDTIQQALTVSAKRELYAALLSVPYHVYVVDPGNIDNSWTQPAEIKCATGSHPFGDQTTNSNSWVTRVVTLSDVGSPTTRWAGLALRGNDDFSDWTSVPGDPSKTNDPAKGQYPNITGPLFAPIGLGDDDNLSMDPLALMADERFAQIWFYCDGYCFNCPTATAARPSEAEDRIDRSGRRSSARH
jgi:hypothetical protein